MKLERFKKCSDIARGLEKADFVLKDAKIVNVFTEEIIEGDIAIADGMIAGPALQKRRSGTKRVWIMISISS